MHHANHESVPVSTTVPDPVTVVEVVAGPDRRPPASVVGRRLVIGRHIDCQIRVDDPTVAATHLLLDLDSASTGEGVTVRATSLVGCRPAHVGGSLVGTSLEWTFDSCCRIVVGGSVIDLRWHLNRSLSTSDVSELAAIDSVVDRSHRLAETSVAPMLGRDLLTHAPRLRPAGAAGDQLAVHRRHSEALPGEPVSVSVPERPDDPPSPPATGLVTSAVGVVGAVVVATVMGSVLFAVFAAVAAVASAVVWAGSWAIVTRDRRRIRTEWAARCADTSAALTSAAASAAEHLRAAAPCPAAASTAAVSVRGGGAPHGLWSKSPGGPLTVTVAFGSRRWQPTVVGTGDAGALHFVPPDGVGPRWHPDIADLVEASGRIDDVPVTIALRAGGSWAIAGRHRHALARSMVVQLTWFAGPRDWRLVIATDCIDRWEWAAHLPHLTGPDAFVDLGCAAGSDAQLRSLAEMAAAVSDDNAAGSGSTVVTVVIVDSAAELGSPESPLRRLVESPAVAAVVVADEAPGWVDEVVRVGGAGGIDLVSSVVSDVIAATAVGVSERTAAEIATVVEQFVDPEVADVRHLPAGCGFVEVHRRGEGERAAVDPRDGAAIAAAWQAGGLDPAPVATIGLGDHSVETIDLAADGPHGLVAGTTGSGKSEFLRTLVLGLAVRSSPEHLALVLVDYKGGAAFDACTSLPHVVGTVTELDGGLATRMLRSLNAELRRRARRFRDVGAGDLAEYRRSPSVEAMPRLVVVVDEFATLASEVPEFLGALVDVARRGRSLGVHLILATQRPAGVVSDDIRSNTALRVALRTQEQSDSIDVVGVADAARLPRSVPGRAVRRIDDDTHRVVQVASASAIDPSGRSELQCAVDAITAAWAPHTDRAAAPPWCPPLPESIAAEDLDDELSVASAGAPEAGSTASHRPHANSAGGLTVPDERREIAAIGVIDDPDRQCRRPLRWQPGDGILQIVGAPGSGTTSTLMAVLSASCTAHDPQQLHLWIVDACGDRRLDSFTSIAHCAGVVRAHERERLRRLVDRLDAATSRDGAVRHLLAIDGLDVLRHRLHAAGPDADPELANALRDLVASGARSAHRPGRHVPR